MHGARASTRPSRRLSRAVAFRVLVHELNPYLALAIDRNDKRLGSEPRPNRSSHSILPLTHTMPLVDSVTMSAPASSKAASDAGKPKENGLHPVHALASPAAQVVRHLQPVLISGLFLAQFSSLVADPVRTLQNSLPIVVAIQVVYAFVSLPAAGSQSARPSRKPRPGEKKKVESTGPNIFIVSHKSRPTCGTP